MTSECHAPLGIANGHVITRPPYRPGDYITYLCSTGFFMTGSPSQKCSTTATWLGSPPHCDPIDFSPKVFNNNSEFTQVPLWLLVAFSSLFAIFVLASLLLFFFHCCFSKRFCMCPSSRAKVRHCVWPLPVLQNFNEEQEVRDRPEQPRKYVGRKCNKASSEKKVSAVTNNQESNNYLLGNYGKIWNETMVPQSSLGDSLPIIYAIPINPKCNQVKTSDGSNPDKTSELNSGASEKFQSAATSVSNQEMYSGGSQPNEPIVYVESDSCVYSDREVAQRFKQTSNKSTVKQQSAFNETYRGQRSSLRAVKPLRQWLPHTHPVRDINTSTK